MKQLSATDASFLYMETPNAPLHISTLAIYDPSTAPGGKVRFKEIINNYNRKIRGISAMTEHLVEVPMQLDHPYWVDNGSFDPEFHIRHIALPKPGDWRQLCILISRLHSRHLDRNRPLWEVWVIEGLDNVKDFPKGCFALFTKMHHAAIDGASGLAMMEALHNLTPDYDAEFKPAETKVESIPSKTELLVRSSINSVRKPLNFLSVAKNTIPGLARTVSGIREGKLKRVTDIPRTRFNTTISPHRVFESANFTIEDIKTIKNTVEGATVNDVALAIVGGALNKYLSAHDELPEQSLAAMAPINIRAKNDTEPGNHLSMMTVQLRTDIDGALERLQAVHDSTLNAKELNNAIGARTMSEYTQTMPSALMAQGMRLSTSLGLANRMNPATNTFVTNVPGPQLALYNTGAKMLRYSGAGPLVDGMGLFHSVNSYCGKLTVSIIACREMMPDPAFYIQCITDTFNEMLSASNSETKTTKKVKKKKTE